MITSADPTSVVPRRLTALAIAAALPLAVLLPSGAVGAAPTDDDTWVPPALGVDLGAIDIVAAPGPKPTLPPLLIPDLEPEWPDDLTIPTLPPEECADYDADRFSVVVGRYDEETIEVQLAYTDPDVCDFTVWTSYRNADDPGAPAAASTTVGMITVATATDSAGFSQLTFDDEDYCSWQVQVAVEEALAVTYPGTEEGCDPDAAAADTAAADTPADEPDAGPVGPGPGPADDPTGGGVTDPPGDPGEAPGPLALGATARPQGLARPDLARPEIASTGSSGTRLLLGLGLVALGLGSIVALLTRRSDDLRMR